MDVVAIRVWIQQNILTPQETYQLCIEKKQTNKQKKKPQTLNYSSIKILFFSYQNVLERL